MPLCDAYLLNEDSPSDLYNLADALNNLVMPIYFNEQNCNIRDGDWFEDLLNRFGQSKKHSIPRDFKKFNFE